MAILALMALEALFMTFMAVMAFISFPAFPVAVAFPLVRLSLGLDGQSILVRPYYR